MLAIITVVYKNYEVLKDFFASLDKQVTSDFGVFVVDLTEEPQDISSQNFFIDVIRGENKGYAHGVNLGIASAIKKGCSGFAIINSDTYVDEMFTTECLKTLEEKPGSIIGGKIYYAPGYEYHKDRYNAQNLGNVLWYAGGKVDFKNAYSLHRGVDLVDEGQYENFEETEFVTGCFMLYDKKVVETVGPWDESYFLYYEDADFCERAKLKGVKLYFDPKIKLWHKNAQSTDGSGSKLQEKYQKQNRLKWGMKYAPLRTRLHLLKNSMLNR